MMWQSRGNEAADVVRSLMHLKDLLFFVLLSQSRSDTFAGIYKKELSQCTAT